jgi:hypothetical protein
MINKITERFLSSIIYHQKNSFWNSHTLQNYAILMFRVPKNSELIMNNVIKIFVLSVVSVFSTATYAQSLSKVVENSEATFYVRTDTFKKTGRSVEFWQITDFKQPKVNKKGETYLSMEQRVILDCSANTQNLVFVKVFSSNMLAGKMIASGSLSQRNPIPYGTSLEVIKNFVCR